MKKVQILLTCLAFLVAMITNASAADLIVDGTSMTLYGEHEYDNVQIINGGTLYVKPYNGTAGTGTLVIDADSIVVDATSSINADVAGYRGVENGNGEGPGGGEGGPTVMDGGGGGGYGGKGGDGSRDYHWAPDGTGGSSYGSATSMSILMGSAGGAAGTRDGDYGGFGGSGGGAISLLANTINIAGIITADGSDGRIYVNDASGGGAGGGILLVGGNVTVNGVLKAKGGNGGTSCGYPPCHLDDGGGGGGGGRIKIFYLSGTISASVSVAGGVGSLYGRNGEEGSYYVEKRGVEATIDIDPDTLNLKSKGKWITCYIALPEGYDVADIDVDSILLEGVIEVQHSDVQDGVLMVKFDRQNVIAYIELVLEVTPPDNVTPTVTGEVAGTPFEGSDTIRVISKGK